jgi:hypothetical protein
MDTNLNSGHEGRSSLAEAQTATREFLKDSLSEVHRVDITKIVHISLGEAAWEAVAEVWQPNPTLKSLGIETQRLVLDHNRYLVRLDALLNVLEYELEGAIGER